MRYFILKLYVSFIKQFCGFYFLNKCFYILLDLQSNPFLCLVVVLCQSPCSHDTAITIYVFSIKPGTQ